MPKSIAGGSGDCAADTTGATKHLAASYKMPIRGIEYRKREALVQPESCISEHSIKGFSSDTQVIQP